MTTANNTEHPSTAALLGWGVLWLAVGGLFVHAALQQQRTLNLSATAGGQHPYLRYAEGIAREGALTYFGDRNRMPLVPAVTALAYDDDPAVFAERAAMLSIALTTALWLALVAVGHALLPREGALLWGLVAAVAILPSRASFVQAELAFYVLLLLTWLGMCRLLAHPRWRTALLAGVLLALAYLTKASALPLLAAYLLVAGVAALGPLLFARRGAKPSATLGSAAVVVGVFLALCSPYLLANLQRFGQPFYNVNSTFFMWCDSWPQAQAFAERFDLVQAYPDAPPDQVPGPVNYWHAHTASQLAARLATGLGDLAHLVGAQPALKYVALAWLWALAVYVSARRRGQAPALARAPIVFSALALVGYVLTYAWYAPIAYGERFVLSLFLPALFAALYVGGKCRRVRWRAAVHEPAERWGAAAWSLLAIAVLAEGVLITWPQCRLPTPAFVSFYRAESYECLRRGELAEAERGLTGVLQLDPAFVPGLRDLGMLRLYQQRYDEAADLLARAVASAPDQADLHNSLGAAMLQAGEAERAVAEFQAAVQLDAEHVSAWRNLAAAYCRLERWDQARRVRDRLQALQPSLAAELTALIDQSERAAPEGAEPD